jgi:HSP20 family protein
MRIRKGGKQMAIIRFNRPFGGAFSELDRIRGEVDRVFNEMSSGSLPRDYSGVYPPVNVYEGKDGYLLTAELAGVNPQDVEIMVTGDNVTMKGERKAEDGGKKASYHRRERGSGYFSRIVALPDRVDPTKVEASSRHGILYVTLPKAEEAKPRQIKIKAGS